MTGVRDRASWQVYNMIVIYIYGALRHSRHPGNQHCHRPSTDHVWSCAKLEGSVSRKVAGRQRPSLPGR